MDLVLRLLTPHHVLLLAAVMSLLRMCAEYARRKAHRMAAFLIGTGSGIAVLLLLHGFGSAIGFVPPVTVYTLTVSAVLGIPGIVLLRLMQLLAG